MPVTFGCSLPSRGAMASSENLRSLAQRAEDLSFDHVWVSDHIIIPHEVSSFYPYAADGVAPFQRDNTYFEPLAALNFLAGCTSRVKLGTHVLILPYRNPVLTAKILATLDVLSGGRLILGAGVGWMEEEFQAMGLDTYAQRGKVTDEYIQIFKELWTSDNPEFHGEHYDIGGAGFLPQASAAAAPAHLDRRPHQPGYPPRRHPGRRLDAHRPAPAGHPGTGGAGREDRPPAPHQRPRRPRPRTPSTWFSAPTAYSRTLHCRPSPGVRHPRANRRGPAPVPGPGRAALHFQLPRRQRRPAAGSHGALLPRGDATDSVGLIRDSGQECVVDEC